MRLSTTSLDGAQFRSWSASASVSPWPSGLRWLSVARRWLSVAFSKNAFSKNAFFEKFANFWRVRSRLYQNEILQENMRLTTFFNLYKICILLHRCNIKIFAKNRFEKTANFVKFQQNFANVAKFAKFCQISKISA